MCFVSAKDDKMTVNKGKISIKEKSLELFYIP